MAKSQLHIYSDGRIHIQTGSVGNYKSFDLPNASPSERKALKCYFDCQIEKGNYGNSFAGSDTKYVPVEVTEKSVVTRVVRAVAPATTIEVSA